MTMTIEKRVTQKEFTGDNTEAFGADPSNPARYDLRYKVVDMDDLIVSHTDAMAPNPKYPKELQPRIRDRAASQVQVNAMAKNMNPRLLLHDSGFLDTGPMIAGSDNVVESGNGRMLALRKAADDFPDRYRLYLFMLKTNAQKYGIEPDDIERIKRPVLIRERITPVDRVKFAAEANVGAVMRMSPYEQSLQDAGRLSDNIIANLQVGEDQSIDQALRSAHNNHVIQHFIGTLAANERATISEAGGNINQQGLDRLKLAIFAKTYTGDAGKRLVRIFGENVDPLVKSIENAVFQSLPDMAKAESLIDAGYRDKELSIASDLAEVIDTYATLKTQSIKISDYLAQQAMFEDKLDSFQKSILLHLDDIARKPKHVRELLREVAQKIVDAPAAGQVTMMGIEPITKEGIVNGTINSQRKELDLPALTITTSAADSKRLAESRSRGDEGLPGVGEGTRRSVGGITETGGEIPGLGDIEKSIKLAPTSAVQTGLSGMGKEAAQVEMLAEFGGAGGGGRKDTLINVEVEKGRVESKPLPGQLTMEESKEPWQMTREKVLELPQRFRTQEEVTEFLGTAYAELIGQTGKPGYGYRGISRAELTDIVRSGGIKSRGLLNLHGEENMTLFADSPQTGLSYASGFAHKNYLPRTNRPGYVIEFKQPSDTFTQSGYLATKSSISASDITKVWEIRPRLGISPEMAKSNDLYNEYRRYSSPRQALFEGKPVPGEVLKDYPDLAPQVEKPKVVITAKKSAADPSEKGETISDLRKVHEKRSERAQSIDEALTAHNVVTPRHGDVWEDQPNRYDIAGIDAPTGTAASSPGETTVEIKPKTKVVITAKQPKPTSAKGEGISVYRKIHEGRSERAQSIDEALTAHNVVTPRHGKLWRKNPNRFDIPGIDAPVGTKVTMPKQRPSRQTKGPRALMTPSGRTRKQKRRSVV